VDRIVVSVRREETMDKKRPTHEECQKHHDKWKSEMSEKINGIGLDWLSFKDGKLRIDPNIDIQIIDRNNEVVLEISSVNDDRLINLFMRTPHKDSSGIFLEPLNQHGDTKVWEVIHIDVPHTCSVCREVGYTYFGDGRKPKYFCLKCKPQDKKLSEKEEFKRDFPEQERQMRLG